MFRSRKPTPSFSISLARQALEAVFDECDRHNVDETGGRLLGTYRQKDGRYEIQVTGVLGPGPNAQRSPTFFMQDGDYQEKLFRAIEAKHPEIEHLGNWHTHHVNGLDTLSGGDKATYTRIVNHAKHNTDFFYALLVVSKNRSGGPRYTVKHFIFRRGDPSLYEIPPSEVRLVESPALRMPSGLDGAAEGREPSTSHPAPNPERAKDQEFFSEFYPQLKALLSKSIGAPYWKGPVSLVDGSRAEVVTMETTDKSPPFYSIMSSCANPAVAETLDRYQQRHFRSARHAVLELERDLNQAIYRGMKG
jgi:hypothetical protein